MAPTEARDPTSFSLPTPEPTDGTSSDQKKADETASAHAAATHLASIADLQKEVLDTLGGINRAWFERAQSEFALTLELANKLAETRSIPESTAIYQQWLGEQMKMLTDHSRQMFADSQKIMGTGARLLSKASGREAA